MNSATDTITVGCQAELELVDRSGKKEHLTVIIVPDESADLSKGLMSENAPLAKAVLGERTGTVIPYLKDDILSVEILSVSKQADLPGKDLGDNRQARMQKIIREVENTNAMVFASSFSGKWGDYDPDSIPKDDEAEAAKRTDKSEGAKSE